MGQYFVIVNLDKKEFLDPRKIGGGLKLWEMTHNTDGALTALGYLLAQNGDCTDVGRWAGDRIVIAGDYSGSELVTDEDVYNYNFEPSGKEKGSEYAKKEDLNLYAVAQRCYKEVSHIIEEKLNS